MTERNQFGLSALFATVCVAALAVSLFLNSRNLFIVFCVSVLPATLTLWFTRKFRNPQLPNVSRTKTGLSLIALSVLFLWAYFLSVGPVIFLDAKFVTTKPGDRTPELITQFYMPISMSIHPDNPISDSMDWYILQWEKAAGIERVVGL